MLVSCLHGRAPEFLPALKEEIERRGLADEVRVVETGCRGFCSMGPVLTIEPPGTFYTNVTAADVPEVVEETLVKGRVVQKLLYKEPVGRKTVQRYEDIPAFAKQKRIVLQHCGMIEPTSIEEYIAVGGYEALGKALTSMTPDGVIAEIKKSGLRGRGGAGFATGRKWEQTRHAHGDVKYVIANGDEGDPGAFMDRALMEGDPHSVIEGMIIGAYAVGASQGYIYVRDEYPLAVRNLGIAIERAREFGLLGQDILGSGFDFDIKIVRGAGAFVCGESSALMQSIEGNVGEPRAKHLHATERGLWDRPSCLNNVETWANVPPIINQGAEWFASIGTERSKGTKAFCLVGKVRNPGLIEVPMGMSLQDHRQRHRRRAAQGAQDQGGADRRAFRRLHPGGAARPAGGLREPERCRLDDGLRRHDRHGRPHLHGGHLPLLPGVPQGRVVRQMLHLPGGHQADAGDPHRPSATAPPGTAI